MMGAGKLAMDQTTSESAEVKPNSAKNANNQPEVALEWSNVKIKFRVVGTDFQANNDEFDLFPNVDPSAPSNRSLMLQKRFLKRTQAAKSNTLSGYIGSSTSERSFDNQSLESGGNNSENGSDKKSSNGSNAGNKPVKHCPVCKKSFTKATYLKRHLMSHSSVKPYKCKICNWGFYQQCNLSRHMASHNLQEGCEGFKCSHCKASFTSKSVLSVHMRDAHGDKSAKKNGQNHQSLVKTPTKSPVPQRAGKATSPIVRSPPTPSNMNKCTICGKQFLTQANLKAHLLYHRGHKSFKCSECGSRFAQKSNLRKHMALSHSGHQCPHCTVMFRSEQDLAQHVASLHSEDETTNKADEEPMLKLDDEDDEEINA